LGTKNLSAIYSYLTTSQIWSTGEVNLVYRFQSENKATNTKLSGSEFDSYSTVDIRAVFILIYHYLIIKI
jgi:hypothetical protein